MEKQRTDKDGNEEACGVGEGTDVFASHGREIEVGFDAGDAKGGDSLKRVRFRIVPAPADRSVHTCPRIRENWVTERGSYLPHTFDSRPPLNLRYLEVEGPLRIDLRVEIEAA